MSLVTYLLAMFKIINSERLPPMIMSDYDTLTVTYRDTTVTPVIQNSPGEASARPMPATLNLLMG